MIQLGAHSWRFNRVQGNADQNFEDRTDLATSETQLFRVSAGLSLCALLGLFSLIWTHPNRAEIDSPIALPPQVRLVADQIKFIPQKLLAIPKPEIRLVELIDQPTSQAKTPAPEDRTQPKLPSPPAPPARKSEVLPPKKPVRAAATQPKTPQAAPKPVAPVVSPQEIAAARAAAQQAALQAAISGSLAKNLAKNLDAAQPGQQSIQPQRLFDGKSNDQGQVNLTRTGKDLELTDHTPTVGTQLQAEYEKANRNVGANGAERLLNSNWVQSDGDGIAMDGGLDKDQVARVINNHIQEIRTCHDSASRRSGKIEGRIQVAFVIDPSGRVAQIKTESSTVSDPQLSSCIVSRLKSWPFPLPRGGVSVSVNYPFVFRTIQAGD